jgi:hypothetical protein
MGSNLHVAFYFWVTPLPTNHASYLPIPYNVCVGSIMDWLANIQENEGCKYETLVIFTFYGTNMNHKEFCCTSFDVTEIMSL